MWRGFSMTKLRWFARECGGWTGIRRVVMAMAVGASSLSWATTTAWAQSTIFNIPTTDTVAVGKGYFEFDYFPEIPAPDGGRFVTYTPRIVFGVVNNVEAGVNVSHFHVNDVGTFSLFQPNVKYKFYADDDKGLAAAAGIIGYIPINHRDDSDSFGQIYANVSKKIKSGARFTGGVWSSISFDDDNTGGVLAGYEQPIGGSKVSFVADWFSGKNFWGYFTPGISIVLPHNGLLNIGYSIGNDSFEDPSNDNRALFVYYGITFP
jgi:hypothetical protein